MRGRNGRGGSPRRSGVKRYMPVVVMFIFIAVWAVAYFAFSPFSAPSPEKTKGGEEYKGGQGQRLRTSSLPSEDSRSEPKVAGAALASGREENARIDVTSRYTVSPSVPKARESGADHPDDHPDGSAGEEDSKGVAKAQNTVSAAFEAPPMEGRGQKPRFAITRPESDHWTQLPLNETKELYKSLKYNDLVIPRWFDLDFENEHAHDSIQELGGDQLGDLSVVPEKGHKGIPKKLHFTWKTDKLSELPELFRKIQLKWRALNPDWEIKIWTDEECDRLIKDHYPEYYSFYSEMKVTAEKSDVFRYLVLDLHGGYYADMDMEPLQPLDGLAEALQKPGCMIGLEPEVHAVLVYNKYHVIGNAFLGARPGHPLWKGFLPHAMKNHYADKMPNELKDATSITGPIAMDRVIQSNPDLTRGCVFLQPDVTAPAFDVKQDMHTRCEHIIRTHKPIYLRGGEAPNPKVQLCRKISRLGNANKDYPVTSFMVHHWAHTWRDKIDEAEEERRRKVVEGETKTEEEAGGEEEAEEGKERKPKEKKIMAESNIGKDVIMPAVHLDVKAILSRSESLTNK